jgi:hypothetical protein
MPARKWKNWANNSCVARGCIYQKYSPFARHDQSVTRYQDGVLEVILPKAEEPDKKEFSIEIEG